MAYDASNGDVYVANYGSHNVSIIQGTSVVGQVQVGSEPENLLFDPGNGYVYVSNYASDNVSVISGTALVGTDPVGSGPEEMAYDPTNGNVYVANSGSGSLSVLSGAGLIGSGVVPSDVGEVAYDAGNGDLYVTGSSCGPSGCSLATLSVLSPVSYTGPAISSFVASPSSVVAGSSTTLTVAATGGVGTLSYAYSGLPPGCATSNTASLTCSPSVSGSYSVRVYVNDTASNSATAIAPLTVTASLTGPTIGSFTASPSTIQTGWTSFLNVSAGGGTGTLSYAYAGLPAGCTTADVASLACSPSSAGSYSVRVYVNDSASHSATAMTTLTVRSPPTGPTISSFSATPSTLTLGAPTTLSVSATGGVGALSYAYSGLPTGCATANTAMLSCTPSVAGTFTIRVYVNDTAAKSATATAGLTVNPAASGPTISSFTASPDSISVGWTTFLNVSASGGTGALSYAFSGLPAGCSSANTASLTCTPSVAGIFTTRVYVNDSASNGATSTTSLIVNRVSGGEEITISSFAASPASVPLGTSTSFSVMASGGTGTLSYSYTGMPAGCPNADTHSLLCTPTEAGTFVVWVFVNDTASHSASTSTTLTVTSTTGVLSLVMISPQAPSVPEGGMVSFTSTAACTGGPCPVDMAYDWSSSNSAGTLSSATSPNTTYTAPPNAGTVVILLQVLANHVVRAAWANVTVVAPATSPPGFLGFGGDTGYLLVGGLAVVVVVALVGVMVVLGRRRRGPAPPTSPGPSGPASSGPPEGSDPPST